MEIVLQIIQEFVGQSQVVAMVTMMSYFITDADKAVDFLEAFKEKVLYFLLLLLKSYN